jgi:hypothetical protein
MTQEFAALKQLIEEAEPDVGKAHAGQHAAGTRLRKKMKEIKDQAQIIRKGVLERRVAADKTK